MTVGGRSKVSDSAIEVENACDSAHASPHTRYTIERYASRPHIVVAKLFPISIQIRQRLVSLQEFGDGIALPDTKIPLVVPGLTILRDSKTARERESGRADLVKLPMLGWRPYNVRRSTSPSSSARYPIVGFRTPVGTRDRTHYYSNRRLAEQ